MNTITMTMTVIFKVVNIHYCEVNQQLTIFLEAHSKDGINFYPLNMPAPRRNGEVYVDFDTLQLNNHNIWLQKFNYCFGDMKALIKAALNK